MLSIGRGGGGGGVNEDAMAAQWLGKDPPKGILIIKAPTVCWQGKKLLLNSCTFLDTNGE